jgi:hypothetical protein
MKALGAPDVCDWLVEKFTDMCALRVLHHCLDDKHPEMQAVRKVIAPRLKLEDNLLLLEQENGTPVVAMNEEGKITKQAVEDFTATFIKGNIERGACCVLLR